MLFRVFDEKCVYLTHVAFFLNFWGALSVLGDGLICNPSTYMQSKHTFHVLHFFLKKGSLKSPAWAHFGIIFVKECDLCVKKEAPKNASKKRCSAKVKSTAIHRPGGSRAAPLARPGLNKKQQQQQQQQQLQQLWLDVDVCCEKMFVSFVFLFVIICCFFFWLRDCFVFCCVLFLRFIFCFILFSTASDPTRSGPRPGELLVHSSCHIASSKYQITNNDH